MRNKNMFDDFHLRKTGPREAVLRVLKQAKKPIDAATILSKLTEEFIPVNRSTIFRMMNTLVAKGLVTRLEFGEGKARYEIANTPHHHHLICVRCKRIQEYSGCSLEDLDRQIEETEGFLVEHHRLEFFGLCQNCS